jgi:hypothetical protein
MLDFESPLEAVFVFLGAFYNDVGPSIGAESCPLLKCAGRHMRQHKDAMAPSTMTWVPVLMQTFARR